MAAASVTSTCTAYDVPAPATPSGWRTLPPSAQALRSLLKRAVRAARWPSYAGKARDGDRDERGASIVLAGVTADMADQMALHGFRLGYITRRPTTETVVVGESGDGSGAWSARLLYKSSGTGAALRCKVTLSLWRGSTMRGTADVVVTFRPCAYPVPFWRFISPDEAKVLEFVFPYTVL